MTREQIIQIAQIGFPDRLKDFINFENAEIHSIGDVHRLYDKDCPFLMLLPKEDYMSIAIGEDDFVQIQVGNKAFNHNAAIKEMERLGLIQKSEAQHKSYELRKAYEIGRVDARISEREGKYYDTFNDWLQ